MKRSPIWIAAWVCLAAVGFNCDETTEITAADLAAVVQSDGVPFEEQTIPSEVIERLASHRVVLVGETHQLREHFELMAALVEDLHSRGFRQLLLEWPHAADWVLMDYVAGPPLLPDWEPSRLLGGAMIEAIRDFNRTLPPSERIHVRAIDVNLSEYGGAGDFINSLRALGNHLQSSHSIETFLERYESNRTPENTLEEFRDELRAHRASMVSAWGEDRYDTVAEMVDVELISVGVRGLRTDHYDLTVRLRESAMKRLVDLRLQDNEHGTVINVGGNHAQKEFLKGTSQEWLGDYLVHKSGPARGLVIVLNVLPARGIPGTTGWTARFDILDQSPENELLRLMNETWPDRSVFLPLDDPLFRNDNVPVNFGGELLVCAPKRHYDAIVLLPRVHHVLHQPPEE